MMPARDRAVVRIGVYPKADLVDVFAGRETGARRNTDRRRRPARRKAAATRGKPIEVRGFDERVAITAHQTATVLVRHDDQTILRLHRFLAKRVLDRSLL